MENRPLNTPGFTDRMTRGELIAAAIYLPIHVVGIPFGISWLAEALPWLYTLSNTQLNVICYGLGLAFVLIGLRGWLRRSFDAALDAKGRFLIGIVGGYAVNIALSFVISALILLLGIELGSSPNNEAVMAESATQMGRIAVVTVVMAPMVEERLFRGCSSAAYARAAACWPTPSPPSPSRSITSGSTSMSAATSPCSSTA